MFKFYLQLTLHFILISQSLAIILGDFGTGWKTDLGRSGIILLLLFLPSFILTYSRKMVKWICIFKKSMILRGNFY